MNGPRIGSLCTGYGGLDEAVQRVFGGSLAWVSDIDPGAAKIIAHRMPGIPNLGDLTTTDWAAVEPVEIVCGGYPCQPFSSAGLRKGIEDERHIWPHIADALRVLRPRHAIFENVAGHLRRGFDTVLADLAGLGFDVEWCTVRASEVGAPHQRNRLFILATASDAPHLGHQRGGRARDGRNGPADHSDAPADASSAGLEVGPVEHHGPERQAAERGRGESPADAARLGRGEGRTEPARQRGRLDAAGGSSAPSPNTARSGQRAGERDLRPGEPDAAWGGFVPAIRRWEHATGRPAPRAVDDRRRLSPLFVEWLMGLPDGHITAVPDLTRNQQLHALGNGVVPQQAEAAIRLLAGRASTPAP